MAHHRSLIKADPLRDRYLTKTNMSPTRNHQKAQKATVVIYRINLVLFLIRLKGTQFITFYFRRYGNNLSRILNPNDS